MSRPLVRVEELEEWISQVTDHDIRNEHLSVSLQNGQVLCHLANALDSDAKLKINRLTTIFHTKSNINAFLQWCKTQGLTEGELFQLDDLLESRNFEAVIATLSILYEQNDGVRYSEANQKMALDHSYSSSTEDKEMDDNVMQEELDDLTKSQYISKAGNKLTSFVKGNLLSVRKKGKFFGKSKEAPRQGTPVGTPPSTPSIDNAEKKAITPSPRDTRANSKLEAFITKVPAPIVASLDGKESPSRPKVKETTLSKKPEVAAQSNGLTSIRSKDSKKKLSEFMASTMDKKPSLKQDTLHASPETQESGTRRAAFEEKKNFAKSLSIPKPVQPSLSKKNSTNTLHTFSLNRTSNTAEPVRKSNKLAAFLANTESPSHKMTLNDMESSRKEPQTHVSPHKQHTSPITSRRTPRPATHSAQRSTGNGNYVRKRQTYNLNRPRPTFSLEEKRTLFMEEQLQIKEEQLQRAAGDASKQITIVPGLQCFIPDETEIWVQAEVLSYDEKRRKLQVQVDLDDGDTEDRQIDLKDPNIIRAIAGPNATFVDSLPISISQDNPEGVQDMRFLRFLNEPSILYNLKQRFEASYPYTYSTDIVIALNPYKWIDNLYGDHLHSKYMHQPRETLAPHVYATSTAAFKHMMQHSSHQSILVSGESGAGKTETTKILMNHLASIAGGRKDKTIAKVIDVNPLLESFGNAKTTRNDNSSRFGKFTQLQFNQKGKLIGAKCETYLLEKSRVVSFASEERNYHIFYQMLAGLSEEELDLYGLDASEAYVYAGGTLEDMEILGMDDRDLFLQTRESLSLIGLNEEDQSLLFQILAGILHLGEIKFIGLDENQSVIANINQLEQVAISFGLEKNQVQQVLCHRSVTARNERVTVPLDPIEASHNRDALAKAIYSNLFDYMVVRINEAIASNEEEIHAQIGVLDIFGFEDFSHNGFEQFCINYANEKLQQKFTIDVFKTVEEEYRREGLCWDHIEYQDNQEILELIEGKLGIIALMNDHLRQPRGTEEALINKIKSSNGKSARIAFPKMKRTQFTMNHYAGSVTYEAVGFMEKHRDLLQSDLKDLVLGSELILLAEIFEPMEARDSATSTGSTRSKKNKSLGTQFKVSLSHLMENISCTNAHYIRCIKPNANKSPKEFDKRMVIDQLRSAGVIEAIRITRSGYPSRLSPKELAERYCIMFPPSFQSRDVRKTCEDFMNAIGRNAPLDYQIGSTLIYLKNGVMEELEAMKSDFYYFEATFIQKIVLGYLERLRLRRKIDAAIRMQAFIRMVLDRIQFSKYKQCVQKIQRCWRRYRMSASALASDSESDRESFESKTIEYEDPVTEGSELSYESSHGPATPPRKGKTLMDRFRMGRTKSNPIEEDEDELRYRRRSSIKRMEELSESAQRMLDAADQECTHENMSLEEENAVLRAENRNLKYDLELMREQCMELQSIIVEINRSRKKGKPF